MSLPALVNRDIIMIGIQPWDFEIGCNFKDMAFVIAKHNRVIYVNRPLDRVTAWRLPDDINPKQEAEHRKRRKGFGRGREKFMGV